jgi:hypothetical protein
MGWFAAFVCRATGGDGQPGTSGDAREEGFQAIRHQRDGWYKLIPHWDAKMEIPEKVIHQVDLISLRRGVLSLVQAVWALLQG